MKKHLNVLLIAWALFLVDQLTKYLFYDQRLLEQWGIFHPAFNTWVSRSVQIPLVFIILIAWFALGAFVVAYQKKYFTWLVFGFLLAGTLGNLVDRVFLDGVRDFIYIGSRFPVFNFADIYLNVGVCLFIIPEFFAWKIKRKS